MKLYPENLMEFEQRFSTDTACREYLSALRWSNGFHCQRCGGTKAWSVNGLFRCSDCRYTTSVLAGTIFQGTRKPLTIWFRAIWWVVGQKNGASAKGVQQILELGSYQTAWTWLHKLRRAMVRPERDLLTDTVEVDETYIGGEKPGKRGSGARGKALVAVAVEDKGKNGMGRIRLSVIPNASQDALSDFVQKNVEVASTIITDDWSGYGSLVAAGFQHRVVPSHDLKIVHLAISLMKRWLGGTLQGAVSHEHLSYYLDEYTFRFNRRKAKHRGLLFYRLLQNAVQIEPTSYQQIIKNVRGRKSAKHNM